MKARIRGIFIGFELLAVLAFISVAISATAQTTFTSAGSIFFTNGVAAANPYPSPIYIGTNGAVSLPGTIQAVTVTLNGFTCQVPKDASIMVEAPNGTAFEIMSGAGGTGILNNVTLTFSDGATAIPSQLTSSGTFAPSVYSPCGVSFPSPAPTVYNAAATCGTSTFANEFTGFNPNGTWQLFVANPSLGASGSATSWALGVTINPPTLSVTCGHTGNFCQGESGAQYSVVVSNAGPGPTGGSVPATVVDTLPAGLTPIAASGSGWNYEIIGQTMICTQTNQTAAGTSYPTLTLMVNVSASAPALVVNAVTLTGSSDGAHTSNSDTTIINPLNSVITPAPVNPFPNSSGNQASAPAGASSYSWTITNGVITSATNLQTITYTAGSSGSVGLTVLISNASGCTAVNSVSVPLMELIDVNFNTNSLVSIGGGFTFGPAMSGAAVLGEAGDQWNGIKVSNGTGIHLTYVNGNNSPVTMTFTSTGGYNVFSFSGTTPFVGSPYEPLMENYLFNAGVPQTITLSGLAASSSYNLVLYNAADTAGAGRTTYFTVNNNTLSSTWDGASSTLIAGTDYVEFPAVLSDSSGNLAITWTGNGSVEGDINGFQIQVTGPQLGIRMAAPGSASVFWPSPGNFVLQTNKNLTSSTWGTFGGSITTANGTNSIIIAPPTGNVFFRLKQ
jgi:hypothetical protein